MEDTSSLLQHLLLESESLIIGQCHERITDEDKMTTLINHGKCLSRSQLNVLFEALGIPGGSANAFGSQYLVEHEVNSADGFSNGEQTYLPTVMITIDLNQGLAGRRRMTFTFCVNTNSDILSLAGKHLGYSDCCVQSYVDDEEPSDRAMAMGAQTGFQPCPTCVHLPPNQLFETIQTQRTYHRPFPEIVSLTDVVFSTIMALIPPRAEIKPIAFPREAANE